MKLKPFTSGFCFGEGPRWHAGYLWFSDTIGKRVYRTRDGQLEIVVTLDDLPSGLGFLPDGRLVMVAMTRRELRVWDGEHLTTYADLSDLTPYPINDMVIDLAGNAYVGGWGYDMMGGAAPAMADLIHVNLRGSPAVCARDLAFPNGCVVSADQSTLIVAESQGRQLTQYDVDKGSLTNRRVWAELPAKSPDGICQDEAGGIWVASPESQQVFRVEQGGAITHEVDCPRKPFACALGGADHQTLFVMAADTIDPAVCLKQQDASVLCAAAPYKGLEHSGGKLI